MIFIVRVCMKIPQKFFLKEMLQESTLIRCHPIRAELTNSVDRVLLGAGKYLVKNETNAKAHTQVSAS
jgi:hypothetical protein